jgi:hypothetical protein
MGREVSWRDERLCPECVASALLTTIARWLVVLSVNSTLGCHHFDEEWGVLIANRLSPSGLGMCTNADNLALIEPAILPGTSVTPLSRQACGATHRPCGTVKPHQKTSAALTKA